MELDLLDFGNVFDRNQQNSFNFDEKEQNTGIYIQIVFKALPKYMHLGNMSSLAPYLIAS
jgi:hypothetical protein